MNVKKHLEILNNTKGILLSFNVFAGYDMAFDNKKGVETLVLDTNVAHFEMDEVSDIELEYIDVDNSYSRDEIKEGVIIRIDMLDGCELIAIADHRLPLNDLSDALSA